MKTCDKHDRCIVVYTEDWRSGQNGCPWCNREHASKEATQVLLKELDAAKEEIENLRDDIKELHQ